MTFLIVLPIAVALWYALVNAGVFAQYFPFPLALAYWLCQTVPRWLLQDLCTRLLQRLVSRWRPPPLLVYAAGGFLGVVLFQPYGLWVIGWFQTTFASYIPPEAAPAIAARWAALSHVYIGTVPQHYVAIGLWVVASLLYDRIAGAAQAERVMRRDEPARAGSAAPTLSVADAHVTVPAAAANEAVVPQRATERAEPAGVSHALSHGESLLAARLRKLQLEDIIAIEAQDHYIRVHAYASSELVYCRFSDALAELQHVPGMRVHRSYWVARKAVKSLRRTGPNQSLVLVNGIQVPIGRSFSQAVRQAGLAGAI